MLDERSGQVDGYDCQSGMPGRRWTVWGQMIGTDVYGAPTRCASAATAPPIWSACFSVRG